jgi:hypothetical protein
MAAGRYRRYDAWRERASVLAWIVASAKAIDDRAP